MTLSKRQAYENSVKKIFTKDNCPFCDLDSQSEQIIWRGKYWYIQHNKYPYLWLKEHIMAVPYSHTTYSRDLTPEEFWEMPILQKFIKDFYWDTDYFSFLRESLWNRSVEHLHYHFLPWVVKTNFIESLLKDQWFWE